MKRVTLEQEKKLRKLGYDKVHCTCGGFPDCICTIENAIITISEALEWFREVKGIECSVNLYQDDTMEDCIYYVGCYKDYDVIRRIEMKLTHSLAESALLDEVMKYVEKK